MIERVERGEQPMHAWLTQRVGVMSDELVRRLRERIPLYREFPDAQLLQGATLFIDHFVTALRTRDLAPILGFAAQNVERRYAQGLSFEAGIQFTAPFRQAFFAVL